MSPSADCVMTVSTALAPSLGQSTECWINGAIKSHTLSLADRGANTLLWCFGRAPCVITKKNSADEEFGRRERQKKSGRWELRRIQVPDSKSHARGHSQTGRDLWSFLELAS